jgi:hypothetical protein
MRRGATVVLTLALAMVSLAAPASVAAFVTLGPWFPAGQVPGGSTALIGGQTFYNVWLDADDVVSVTSVSLSGTDAADFSFGADGCTGMSLGASLPNSTCSVTIAFTPTRVGLETATIRYAYTSTSSGSGTIDQPIDAIGGPVGELCGFRSYPMTVAFADTFVGQSAFLGEFDRLRIVNCGTADLHVTDVVVSGADAEDFVLGPNTCTGTYPQFEGLCYADLAFQPASPGQKEAIVTVYSDGVSAPQVLTITGFARAVADLGVSITALPNPDPAVRGGQIDYSITVTNYGPNTSEQSFVAWGFFYPGEFESVSPEASCDRFYPGSPGMGCIVWLPDVLPNGAFTFTATARIGTSGIPAQLDAYATIGSSGTADLGYENNFMTVTNSLPDIEPPTVRFDNNQSPYSLEQWVDIPCIAEDNAGIDWSRTYCPYTSGPAYSFDLSQTINAIAYDLVGYRADASTTLVVRPDYPSMKNLTAQWISKAGVAKSALGLLESAAKAEARGNANAEAGKLGEYRSLIQAQSGKAITVEFARILMRFSFGL